MQQLAGSSVGRRRICSSAASGAPFSSRRSQQHRCGIDDNEADHPSKDVEGQRLDDEAASSTAGMPARVRPGPDYHVTARRAPFEGLRCIDSASVEAGYVIPESNRRVQLPPPLIVPGGSLT